MELGRLADMAISNLELSVEAFFDHDSKKYDKVEEKEAAKRGETGVDLDLPLATIVPRPFRRFALIGHHHGEVLDTYVLELRLDRGQDLD